MKIIYILVLLLLGSTCNIYEECVVVKLIIKLIYYGLGWWWCAVPPMLCRIHYHPWLLLDHEESLIIGTALPIVLLLCKNMCFLE